MNQKESKFTDIDETDKIILNMLQKDAKTTIQSLSEATGKSSTAVRSRLQRLEKDYIKAYAAILECSKMGYREMLLASCRLNATQRLSEIKENVEKMREVRNAYITTGEYQLFVMAKCLGHDHAMMLIESLQNLPGVEEVKTQMVLDRIKEDHTIIIP